MKNVRSVDVNNIVTPFRHQCDFKVMKNIFPWAISLIKEKIHVLNDNQYGFLESRSFNVAN